MTAAAVLTLPLGVATAGTALFDPVTLGLGATVAGLSSVLPYTLELLALRRMPTSTFAVLVSLGPAIAAVAGLLVLGQSLAAGQVAAIVLVVAASAGAVRTSAADLPR
jgi:inner membrane transporter RhtA